MKKSQYTIGQDVMLTKNYHRFSRKQIVTVQDPYKYGSKYAIKVCDAFGHIDFVLSKYLKKC